MKEISKLDPRAEKHIFVGYADGPKAIRYYDRKTHRVKISRNFLFESGNKSQQYLEETVTLPLEGESGEDSQQSSQIKSAARPKTPESISSQIEDAIEASLPATPEKPKLKSAGTTTPLQTYSTQ